MPPPCFQRPWRSISWVGAPFWAMRRAMPTRPLCPLKNSQFGQTPRPWPIAFTRRAICDSDSPNTFCLTTNTGRPDGVQSFHCGMGVMATTAPCSFRVGLGADHGDAAAAVVPALGVAPGQRRRLGLRRNPPSDRTATRARSKRARSAACSGRFEAAAALAGLDGGDPDDGEHVGGEGAGLALGPGQSRRPQPFRRLAHAPVPAGGLPLAGPLVGLGDGGGGQAQGGNTGAGAGADRQVARHGEGLRRHGTAGPTESHQSLNNRHWVV